MAERHAGQVRKANSAPFLLHPLEVGALLHVFGYPERVIAAGLLHDILESSDTTVVELRMRFGLLIAGLVEAVSENPAVQDAVERKAPASASGGDRGLRKRPRSLRRTSCRRLPRDFGYRAACDARVTGDPTWRLKLDDHYLASGRMLEQQAQALTRSSKRSRSSSKPCTPCHRQHAPNSAFTSL